MATVTGHAVLTGTSGRAIATARGNHFVVDSPPPLGGPNEEINPIDILLSALTTCGVFVTEKAAEERGINLSRATASVEGDFDPRGVQRDATINPRMQALRLQLTLEGPTDDEAGALVEDFKRRCPVYTTLVRAVPIEVTYRARPQAPRDE